MSTVTTYEERVDYFERNLSSFLNSISWGDYTIFSDGYLLGMVKWFHFVKSILEYDTRTEARMCLYEIENTLNEISRSCSVSAHYTALFLTTTRVSRDSEKKLREYGFNLCGFARLKAVELDKSDEIKRLTELLNSKSLEETALRTQVNNLNSGIKKREEEVEALRKLLEALLPMERLHSATIELPLDVSYLSSAIILARDKTRGDLWKNIRPELKNLQRMLSDQELGKEADNISSVISYLENKYIDDETKLEGDDARIVVGILDRIEDVPEVKKKIKKELDHYASRSGY